MTRDELLARISINPKVCFGKPCLQGRRIWVSLVLDFLAGGMSVEEVIAACQRERRGLVTLDLDFSNPLVFRPSKYSGPTA